MTLTRTSPAFGGAICKYVIEYVMKGAEISSSYMHVQKFSEWFSKRIYFLSDFLTLGCSGDAQGMLRGCSGDALGMLRGCTGDAQDYDAQGMLRGYTS